SRARRWSRAAASRPRWGPASPPASARRARPGGGGGASRCSPPPAAWCRSCRPRKRGGGGGGAGATPPPRRAPPGAPPRPRAAGELFVELARSPARLPDAEGGGFRKVWKREALGDADGSLKLYGLSGTYYWRVVSSGGDTSEVRRLTLLADRPPSLIRPQL